MRLPAGRKATFDYLRTLWDFPRPWLPSPNDPRNELAAVLSFVPFFAQTVMPARYALGVAPLWEVGVSALLTLVAIVVVVRLAGRVYRNSILRTGSRVSLREALRG